MKNYNNELLNNCSSFAEKHRVANNRSGPHWSTIIRFTQLFDEAVRLQTRVDKLENDRQLWRWIPIKDWKIEEDGVYVYENKFMMLEVGYFEVEKQKEFKHYVVRVIPQRLPPPPQESL